MMFGKKVLGALAFGAGALVGQASACSCIFGELCDSFKSADVVLRAEALSRSDQVDINDDVTYTVNTVGMYKEEPGVLYAQVISFITAGNGGLCGIYMEIGQEYLIDLVRNEDDGELHAVGLCGAFRSWSSVTEEDLYLLEDGCEDDSCGNYSYCFEFQECLLYAENTEDEEYYCADVCEPSPCRDEEACTLEPVTCYREPCPPVAVCNPDDDPCDLICGDFAVCRIYMEGTEDEQQYCEDFCDDTLCGFDEECFLDTSVECVREPCPPPAACRPT